MICQLCGRRFWGRPDAKYDTKVCRRKAAVLVQIKKTEAAHEAFIASLTPEERSWRETATPVEIWAGYDFAMKKISQVTRAAPDHSQGQPGDRWDKDVQQIAP